MTNDKSEEISIAEKIENELLPGQSGRFQKQIEFILEADKLKNTLRRTIITDKSRRENSAEHSWHIALTVLVLSEYADVDNLDLLQVIKLLLAHDLVEIDAGFFKSQTFDVDPATGGHQNI